jgi:hypothetical protein
MKRLLCLFGFHRYMPVIRWFGEVKITERRCIRCHYSPTWER